jgi:hypothetical protein
MNAARLQNDALFRHRRAAGTTTNRGDLTFFEATLFPLTGAFGRWWSSEGELSMVPEGFFEVENAYLRGTYGNQAMRGNLRFGVFHPFEGYGASDRPVTIARPTLQVTPAAWGRGTAQTTWFTPWGFDEPGVEVGFTYQGFNVTGTLFNGLVVLGDSPATYTAHPFQGGNLVRNNNDPNFNAKDYQVFANQFFGDAAIAVHYYHGTLSVPVAGAIGTAGSVLFTDRFDKVTLYGTYPIPRFAPEPTPQVWLLGGIERGWDTGFNGVTATSKFISQGYFVEPWLVFNSYIGLAGRFDWFDPSRRISGNTIKAATVAVNAALLNGAQAILEYRHVLTATSPSTNINLDQAELRVIYIF